MAVELAGAPHRRSLPWLNRQSFMQMKTLGWRAIGVIELVGDTRRPTCATGAGPDKGSKT